MCCSLYRTFKLCQLVSLGPETAVFRRLERPAVCHSDVAMHDDMFDVSDTEEQNARSISTSAPSSTKLESPDGGNECEAEGFGSS